MNFDSIIGQREVIHSLLRAIHEDRVGHAYIFTGPKGIGKRTIAGIFAGLLLWEKSKTHEPCGECISCRTYTNRSNPDFRIIEPANASIGIEEIRELQSDVAVRPLYSNKKIYLVLEADKMTVQAQNCLLKTLEEPPEYTVILLTTSNYDALLETIRSRTLKYSFKKNTYEEVCAFLNKHYNGRLTGMNFIAAYADGVIGTALALADSDEFITLREKTLEILKKLPTSRLDDIFGMYDFFEANKQHINSILDIMLFFFRDLLVVKKAAGENLLINSDKKDIILDNIAGYSVQRILRNIEMIEQTRKNFKYNANYQLSIEVMLMKLQEENL